MKIARAKALAKEKYLQTPKFIYIPSLWPHLLSSSSDYPDNLSSKKKLMLPNL